MGSDRATGYRKGIEMSGRESPFQLSRVGCVRIRSGDKVYQLRVDQLSVHNVSRIFNFIPDTVLLVSSEGTVAFPDEHGQFCDVDDWLDEEWEVQGTEASKRAVSGLATSALAAGTSGFHVASKWRPSVFPARTSGSKHHSSLPPVRVWG